MNRAPESIDDLLDEPTRAVLLVRQGAPVSQVAKEAD